MAVPCKTKHSTNVVAIIILSIFEGNAREGPQKVESLGMRSGRTNIWKLKLETKVE